MCPPVALGNDDHAEIVAVVDDEALLAERFRPADAAAVEDQRVGRSRPALRRHRRAQLLLDDDRIVRLGDADAVRDAQHVTVDRQPGNAEGVAEHDVGGLASHSRQLDQLLHRLRHFAAVIRDQRLRHAEERFRLGAEESGRVNLRLELRRCGPGERARVGVALEQCRRHRVDERVGGLRGQDRRRQQLERRREVQLGVGAGMLRLELVEDLARLSWRFHRRGVVSGFTRT